MSIPSTSETYPLPPPPFHRTDPVLPDAAPPPMARTVRLARQPMVRRTGSG